MASAAFGSRLFGLVARLRCAVAVLISSGRRSVPPARRPMSEPGGPRRAREVFDRIESEIVDSERAAGGAREERASGETAQVPGSPEPPD